MDNTAHQIVWDPHVLLAICLISFALLGAAVLMAMINGIDKK